MWLLLLLLEVGPTQAYQYQPVAKEEPSRPSSVSLGVPVLLGAGLDIASTEWALAHCSNCREGNTILGNKQSERLFVKGAGALAFYSLTRVASKDHPKTAKWMARGYLVFGALSAAWNVKQGLDKH
jgi:hypothetical protein